jgi:hypothetical protein
MSASKAPKLFLCTTDLLATKKVANNEAPSNQIRAARALKTFKPNLLMPLSNRRKLTPARGSLFLFLCLNLAIWLIELMATNMCFLIF